MTFGGVLRAVRSAIALLFIVCAVVVTVALIIDLLMQAG